MLNAPLVDHEQILIRPSLVAKKPLKPSRNLVQKPLALHDVLAKDRTLNLVPDRRAPNVWKLAYQALHKAMKPSREKHIIVSKRYVHISLSIYVYIYTCRDAYPCMFA